MKIIMEITRDSTPRIDGALSSGEFSAAGYSASVLSQAVERSLEQIVGLGMFRSITLYPARDASDFDSTIKGTWAAFR